MRISATDLSMLTCTSYIGWQKCKIPLSNVLVTYHSPQTMLVFYISETTRTTTPGQYWISLPGVSVDYSQKMLSATFVTNCIKFHRINNNNNNSFHLFSANPMLIARFQDLRNYENNELTLFLLYMWCWWVSKLAIHLPWNICLSRCRFTMASSGALGRKKDFVCVTNGGRLQLWNHFAGNSP